MSRRAFVCQSFHSDPCKITGGVALFFLLSLVVETTCKKGIVVWGAIYLRIVRWQRPPAEKGAGLFAAQGHYKKRHPEGLLLPGWPSLA